MATKRIKDISTTATTFAADDFIALDASSVGTRKMAKASLITQVGANYLEKADNLSDVASKDTSKLNLEVPNVGTAANEVSVNGMLGDLAFQSSAGVVVDDLTVDGELIAAVGKPMPVNGPTMRFDGVDDHVAFAAPVGSAFSFTNSTDDTPFTVASWVKMEDATSGTILSKFGSSSSTREYRLFVDASDLLTFDLRDASANSASVYANTAMTGYENQWVHVAATYAGSGPNSATAFASAADAMSLYINGKSVALTKTNNASYYGMSNTAGAVDIGRRYGADYVEGQIRDAKLFNKALSAAEVKEVYSNGQLPNSFSESTGAITYVSDFSAGVDGFGPIGDATVTGNEDGIGPAGDLRDDNLKIAVGTALNVHVAYKTVLSFSKKFRVEFDYYMPSSNSHADGFNIAFGSGGYTGAVTAVTDSWQTHSVESVCTASSDALLFYLTDGGSLTFQDSGGDDVFYIRNVRVTQIGSVLDARAEQFDTSTGKLYDLSGNGFVGTQSGGVSLLGRKFPVYETGTWTPTVSFGGGSTGVGYSYQAGSYSRIGNTVHIQAAITLTSVGTDTGGATIGGLPFTSYSANYATASMWSSGMSGLTSNILGRVTNSGSEIDLYDSSATGSSYISNVNFTASSMLRFSTTYQIS